MECLQTLLDSSTTPALAAFLLGLLTAVSPCPLATNITAIGFIGRDIENRHRVFLNGLLYTLGRVIAYTALGVALILILREGANLFGVQKFIGKYGELVLGPVLLLIGLFMLFGSKLKLPSFGFNGSGEGLARKGGLGAFLLGMLFAMAFCPTSGVFYFGMLIPMSATASAGYLLPVLFAVATALPVLVVAWMLAFSVQRIGSFYGRMQTIQKWLNRIVGWVFMGVGIYYCIMVYL
jgi:cytochrome c biogenesis protein CcdA